MKYSVVRTSNYFATPQKHQQSIFLVNFLYRHCTQYHFNKKEQANEIQRSQNNLFLFDTSESFDIFIYLEKTIFLVFFKNKKALF